MTTSPPPCPPDLGAGPTAGPRGRRPAPAGFRAQVREPSDGEHVLCVHLHGEVDIAAAPVLAEVQVLLDGWDLAAVVDLSGVAFLDCAGLAALLALGSRGRRPALCEPSAPVRRLFELTGVAGRDGA